MPRYDRTGPMGAGPGTGRGNCRQRPGLSQFGGVVDNSGVLGAGRTRGGFRGRCLGVRGFRGQSAGATGEVEALRATLSAAKEEIAVMEARLAELEKDE